MAQSPLMNTYNRLSVSFERGEGAWLYDTEGNRYLDALCGIAVCGLGHAHPAITRAITEQAGKLIHTSNLYDIPLQQQLAQRLVDISGLDNAFFCNSGAEANEAAIKIARRFGHSKGIDKPAIIVMEGAFHGRTLATLSATANRAAQAGFEPLVGGFIRVPFNDIDAVRCVAASHKNIAAILVEPIQGESGIRIPNDDYLPALRQLCDEQDWLLMLDEVQSGNGRTGRYFAYQHTCVVPDVVTTAKGLGNGFPIGACLAKGRAAQALGPGSHGTTFGGTPLACAAALAVTDTIMQEHLCERAQQLGDRMLAGFKEHLDGMNYIRDIRGQGLMLAIELNEAGAELAVLAKIKGILLNITGQGHVIRLLPPLTLTDNEADLLTNTLIKLIKVYAADERAKPRK